MSFEMKIELVKLLLVPPLFGAAITLNFFLILNLLGLEFDKKVKLKCFIPITILVLLFNTLIRVSSC